MDRTRTILAVTVLLALSSAACSASAGPAWTWPPESSPKVAGVDSAPGSPAPGHEAVAAGVLGTVTIKAIDLGFQPATLTVAQAGTYEVVFQNTGVMTHDVTFAD